MGYDCTYSLHGFSDSSEKAYAAAVYLLCSSAEHTTSYLLISRLKSGADPELKFWEKKSFFNFFFAIITSKLPVTASICIYNISLINKYEKKKLF